MLLLFSQLVPDLKRDVKHWQDRVKSFDAIEDLRKKVDELKFDMAGAIVANEEKVCSMR